jgi:hypothetical protein
MTATQERSSAQPGAGPAVSAARGPQITPFGGGADDQVNDQTAAQIGGYSLVVGTVVGHGL